MLKRRFHRHSLVRAPRGAQQLVLFVALAVLFGALALPLRPAFALEAVAVAADQDKIDMSPHAERFSARGDHLQIETAPGADGLTGRVDIKAQVSGTNPGWMVFALRNSSDKVLERWLVAERFTFIGSGITFPDLDHARITAVTPSQGFVPDRITSDRADIFQISIDPGQTVTFAAEMASERFPQIALWKPFVYEAKQRERTLLNGILLGITGLLAVFLTALFAANAKAMFPATGLLAWSVLALLCVDFDFWHRIFRITAEDNALYRAGAEAAVAASLVLFLYTFLKIARWHSWIRLFWLGWLLAQLAVVVIAPLDPGLAATLARMSFLVIGGLGSLFILYLVFANQDRALALLPSWLLLLVWVFAAALAANGRLAGDFIAAGLESGLVLILLLLGFSVSQFAFRAMESVQPGSAESTSTRNFAIEGAGVATFEWNSRRNEVQTGALIEDVLGLPRGRLSCGLEDWLRHVGGRDQERLSEQFKDIAVKGSGLVQTDFMMRASDNTQHWFALRATTLPQTDPRTVRCVGLLRETTREKHAQDRIMQDAVRDHKTGLPNRELFLDRLAMAVKQAKLGPGGSKLGLILFELSGLSAMLKEFDESTVENGVRAMLRLLQAKLGPLDTAGRIGSDRYAILMPDTGEPAQLAKLIDELRQAVCKPVPMGRTEQMLNANFGVALLLDPQTDAVQLVDDAQLALERAKRAGIDRYEVFRPAMRSETDPRAADVALLRQALERKQFTLLYQPIYGLAPERLAGFEALARWQHPERGPQDLAAFMPIAEDAGFSGPLALHLMEMAAKSAMAWQKALPRDEEPLFVGIQLGSGLPLRVDMVSEVRKLLTRVPLARGVLRLHLADDLIRENPELAGDMLERLRGVNAGICLCDFGSGQFPIAQLPRLAIDCVKLDRWMCVDALASEPGIALLRGVSLLVRELGLAVQTDAIETPADVAILRGAGCTLGGGPLYGQPLKEGQVTELLATVRSAEKKGEKRGSLTGGLLGKVARGGGEPTQGPSKSQQPSRPAESARRPAASSPSSQRGQNGATAVPEAVASAMPADFDEGYEQTASDTPSVQNGMASDPVWQGDGNRPPPPAAHYVPQSTPPQNQFGGQSPPSQQGAGQAALSAEPQHVGRSDTPTVKLSGQAAAPMGAASTQIGLARLQRGQFGYRPPAGAAPVTASQDAAAAPVVTAAAQSAAVQLAALAAQAAKTVPPPGSPGSAFADALPDADILRGLAARLEAALKRDGN